MSTYTFKLMSDVFSVAPGNSFVSCDVPSTVKGTKPHFQHYAWTALNLISRQLTVAQISS